MDTNESKAAQDLEKLKKVLLEKHGIYFENRFDIDNIDDIIAYMELQDAITQALVSTYTTVELADLDNDTYVNIGCLDYVHRLMDDMPSTQGVLNRVVGYLIAPEFQEEAAVFHDTRTLPERLKAGTVSMDYNGSVGGWLRGQIIPVSAHENGDVKEAIFTVQRLHDNKSEIERLKKLSETDGLSQLFNRTGGIQRIINYLNNDHEGMYCLFDVDNFKHFNDEYGHAAGDEIIQSIGNCMKGLFRNRDVLLRVGGDEFGIFIPQITSKEAGESRIKEFQQQVQNLKFTNFDEPVTISCGTAYTLFDGCHTYDMLSKVADDRMYEQKNLKKQGDSQA